MLFLSVGRALPSHYTGSRTNHRLCVSVSPNLSPFSLLSLVIFLFHSLRQLPSSTGPQSTLITFSFCMHSISLAALSIFPGFFFFFLLSVKLPCVTVSSLFCQVSTLLIAHCFLLYFIYFLFLSPQLKIWILRSMYTWWVSPHRQSECFCELCLSLLPELFLCVPVLLSPEQAWWQREWGWIEVKRKAAERTWQH